MTKRFWRKKQTQREKGFTLVELIVGMFVFVIAVGLSVGAFIQALRTERATVHVMSMNSNASIMIEQMAREVRTGIDFETQNDSNKCSDYGEWNELKFINSSRGNEVYYRFDELNQVLARKECRAEACSTAPFETLSAPDIRVNRACFSLLNSESVPRIIIRLQISSANKSLENTSVNIQSTVSGRIIPSLDL